MDIDKLLTIYRAIRRLYLYETPRMVLDPEAIADILDIQGGMEVIAEPADVLVALAYGMICEDRFEFDIKIKYRSLRSRKNPVATFTFAGRPVNRTQVKQISMFEKRYGEMKFKKKGNPQ
ncbi:MAG: hypothetical protein NTZ34_12460 [Chloroflexi bacterium]|nr:hypothetical protein [Chloroflexota bacterium]